MKAYKSNAAEVIQAMTDRYGNSTKTSCPYGKARDCQSIRSYPNALSIETYRRDWEKSEKKIDDVRIPLKFDIPLDLEYQKFKKKQ